MKLSTMITNFLAQLLIKLRKFRILFAKIKCETQLNQSQNYLLRTVLEANRKRTEAYNLEQEALRVLDEKVIYAR